MNVVRLRAAPSRDDVEADWRAAGHAFLFACFHGEEQGRLRQLAGNYYAARAAMLAVLGEYPN